MRLIIIAFPDDNYREKHLYKLPKTSYTGEDALLLCETDNGIKYGLSVCDNFDVDDKEVLGHLCAAFDTSVENLRPIRGRVYESFFDDSEAVYDDN